jgi:hypothetical protein
LYCFGHLRHFSLLNIMMRSSPTLSRKKSLLGSLIDTFCSSSRYNRAFSQAAGRAFNSLNLGKGKTKQSQSLTHMN